ncbi:cytochrome oxidase biogenesis protein [Phaffia rhodozyma]|uniref:Cytochrome oxidase biogenesis protein n=1 Tax=Phaffia rhodozyma TaxID=264483 RepID=A0A0F7SQQ9_PHARH|nr:cytochrome oxidase biogenesis protein [Phaffia rhodozyma]
MVFAQRTLGLSHRLLAKRAFNASRTPLVLRSAPILAAHARPFSLWPSSSKPAEPLAPADIESSVATPVNLPQPPSIPTSSVSSVASTPSSGLITPDASPLGLESGVVDPLMDLAKLPLHYGDLKAMGLGSWWPTGWIQSAFEAIQVSTGLPWWATIVSLTFATRLALFPTFIGSIRTAAGMVRIQPEMASLQEAMSRAKSNGDTTSMQSLAIEMRDLFKRHNVNPLNALKQPLVTMPVFISMFLALKWMAELPVPQLKLGGIPGWCTDLTVADPTYILPVTSAAATWLVAHFGANGAPHSKQPDTQIAMSGIIKTISIMGIPFFGGFTIPAAIPLIGGMSNAGFPAAILLYWTCSNSFTFFQSIILRSDAVRKVLKLEPVPEKQPNDEKPLTSIQAIRKMMKPTIEKFEQQKKALDEAQSRQARYSTTARLSEKKSVSDALRERKLAEEAKRASGSSSSSSASPSPSTVSAAAAAAGRANPFESPDKEGWDTASVNLSRPSIQTITPISTATPAPTPSAASTSGKSEKMIELERQRKEIQERIDKLQKALRK